MREKDSGADLDVGNDFVIEQKAGKEVSAELFHEIGAGNFGQGEADLLTKSCPDFVAKLRLDRSAGERDVCNDVIVKADVEVTFDIAQIFNRRFED